MYRFAFCNCTFLATRILEHVLAKKPAQQVGMVPRPPERLPSS